jgi:hypothetical protein
MPQYVDLVRRAVEARERAEELVRDADRINTWAKLLRDADAGNVLLLRCAWCDRFDVGGEWLNLEAIGDGERRITSRLRRNATHGICDDCLATQLRASQKR